MQVPFAANHQESGLNGRFRLVWAGFKAPDGDVPPWSQEAPGSLYLYINKETGVSYWYEKRKDDLRDDDWGALGGMHVISQTVSYDEFTDGGSTSGTFTLHEQIPAGALVQKTVIHDVVGFAGNASAALIVGDGTDGDRYMTSTLNVFSNVAAIDGGAVSGVAVHTEAKPVVLTITSGSDFTAVNAGRLTVKVFYLY